MASARPRKESLRASAAGASRARPQALDEGDDRLPHRLEGAAAGLGVALGGGARPRPGDRLDQALRLAAAVGDRSARIGLGTDPVHPQRSRKSRAQVLLDRALGQGTGEAKTRDRLELIGLGREIEDQEPPRDRPRRGGRSRERLASPPATA